MVRPNNVKKPSRTVCLKIAAFAECDPRSVARYFKEPERAHPLIVSAIRRALPMVGLQDPHPAVQP